MVSPISKVDSKEPYQNIGILGGMGPDATAELYLRIIRLFQTKLKAQFDRDYPEIFIYNLPLPDVVLTTKNERMAKRLLIRAAKSLERIGTDFIVIPCNTIEYFITDIRKSVKIPIISIVEEVNKFLKRRKIKKVGLLATETTVKYRTYEKELSKSRVRISNLKSKYQRKLTKIILDILSGQKLESDKKDLKSLIKSLNSKYVILGCTELPLLISQKDSKIKLIDTLDVLAETTFKLSRGN